MITTLIIVILWISLGATGVKLEYNTVRHVEWRDNKHYVDPKNLSKSEQNDLRNLGIFLTLLGPVFLYLVLSINPREDIRWNFKKPK